MKKEIDKDGRMVYKFSHSVARGGYLYAHKCREENTITNKDGLRYLLQTIAKKYELIDVTIKVYDKIFFLFFQMKLSLAPQEIIDAVQEKITSFSEWDEDYVITGVDELQEKYLRKDLEKWGMDYDKE
ncbi:TPA: hypothetical protein HA241_02915 [Candidatus Woesearchaeota archaeon]|nr:hypothetical protein [Candidatus Woesearchaeota archaeon]